MREYLILIVTLLFITACGTEEPSVTEDEAFEDEQEATKEEAETKEELIVEIEDQIVQKYVDSSFSEEVVGIYAKVTNNANTPVSVFDVQVTLYDSNDDILSVENDEDLISPSMLNKGDSGYLSLNIDYEDNFNDLDHVEINYETYELEDEDIIKMKVTKENILKHDGFFVDEYDKERFDSPISDAIKVMFNLENEYDEELGYMFGIGFYNKDNEFIGSSVSTFYNAEDDIMQANDNRNIEVMEFLPVEYEEIEKVDINVIGIPFEI